MNDFLRRLNHLRFSTRDKIAFLEDLSSMVRDGIAPKTALEILSKISTDLRKELVMKMLNGLAAGRELADGMVGFFPHYIIETVRAGESSGTLSRTLSAVTEYMRGSGSVVTSMIAALLYPCVVIIAACVVMVFLKHSVLEQFSQIEPVSMWPTNGQTVMMTATFLEHWWILIVIAIIAAIIGLRFFLTTNTSPMRKVIDRIPVFSIYRKMVAGQLMESLGILIDNGIVFKQSLKLLLVNANPYLTWHLLVMEHRLSRGTFNIAEVLDTGLLEQKDVLRLQALANVKGFEIALERQGKASAASARRMITVFCKLLGGILMGVGAFIAAYLVMAMYAVGASLHTVA